MKFLTPLSFYFLLLCVVFTSFSHNWSVIIHQTALHSTHHPPYVVLQFHSVMSYVTCTYLGKNINIHTTFISNSHLLFAFFSEVSMLLFNQFCKNQLNSRSELVTTILWRLIYRQSKLQSYFVWIVCIFTQLYFALWFFVFKHNCITGIYFSTKRRLT